VAADPADPAILGRLADPTVLGRLVDHVGTVVRGKQETVRLAVVALLARGHLLIEDVPGVGKTTLAQSLAAALGLSFQRIQFTSDLLPSDIIGVSVFKRDRGEFEFQPGPLFAHIVLADEINRATPKTQSALLEAMSEGTVSVDRQRYLLPQPFLVLATQNPLEHQGTFPLPESQLDRFAMSLQLGYPSRDHERELLLSGGVEEAMRGLQPLLDQATLEALQAAAQAVHVEPKVADYMIDIAQATRRGREFTLGVSTRGVQSLYRTAQAYALAAGRDFVTPDDVQLVVPHVLGHRVLMRDDSGSSARRRLAELLDSLPVPV
jgi:MoxR-like ATPase